MALLAAAIALAACAPAARGPETPATRPSVSDRGYPLGELRIERAGRALLELRVEIADTPEARGIGLMHVESLPGTAGMAFLFDRPSQGAFYMKNTLIPLDIAFWDAGGRIVDILQMQPCRADPCPLYSPQTEYVGAVEVNLGLLASKGVRPGDRVLVTR